MHRVAFYADIFYNSERSPAYWIPPENLDVDAILLGGDIHYSPRLLGEMLADIRRTQAPSTAIIVVPGNGEYFGLQLAQARQEYKAIAEDIPNAHFLDDETLLLPGGLRIVGSTLWSNVPEDLIGHYDAMWTEDGMSGIDNIKLGDRYLTTRDANELHRAAVTFIEGELRGLTAAGRDKTVVCTHFWPTLRPWMGDPDPHPDHDEPRWLHFVGTDLDELIAQIGPKFWLCGHAHTTHQVTIGTTLVASNPRAGDGPEHLNPEFAASCVVEL